MVAAPEWAQELTKRLWAPPPRVSGSEWALRFRVLGDGEPGIRPGPFVPEPWQRLVLDALADPSVDWLVVLKAVQMGVSELVRCAIGYWAMCAPGNVLWVMATQDKARTAMEKLQWMFQNSPALRGMVVEDTSSRSRKAFRAKKSTLMELVLKNGMRISVAWAGSPASLSSDVFRYGIGDETGKWPRNLGRKGQSPVKMLEGRTKTYGRQGKVVLLSSPDHEEDLICTEFEKVRDKRRFAVPCPDCGKVQPLGWDAARWPGGSPENAPREMEERGALADRVELLGLSGYACGYCDGQIHSVTEAMRSDAATWVRADLDGNLETSSDVSTRRLALHISELYHWKTSPSDLAAKYLRTPVHELQNFYNDSLGLPLKDATELLRSALFRMRAVHAPGIVPDWATHVIATADTQKDHFYYVVRAWGPGDKSMLLTYGIAKTEDELLEETLGRRFPVADSPVQPVGPSILLIDSGGGMETPDGSTTHRVYKLCERTPLAIPYKGEGNKSTVQGKPVWKSQVNYTPKGLADSYGVELVMANANFWKDWLSALILAEAPVLWKLTTIVGEDYVKHMVGQHRVTKMTKSGMRTTWTNRGRNSRHDWWDCEYMQGVALWLCSLGNVVPFSKRSARRRRYKAQDTGNGWTIGR